MNDLSQLDLRHLWHPFTPASIWEEMPLLVIERGDGNYLVDSDGNRYFDGISSLWTNVHGHNHPRINAAIRNQLDKIAHTTLLGLSSGPSIQLAASLANMTPGDLNRVFFSDSGSTAVEIALKQSFQYWALTGKPEKSSFAHLQYAYHGDTIGAVSVGGIDIFHATFGPMLFKTYELPSPHPYRHPKGSDPTVVLDHCLHVAENVLEQQAATLAAVIVEPLVQGAAGILVHPPGYLSALAALCRQYHVHLIVDEVATGFGRTGAMFACEHESVTPDFLCLAKGITGGYLPLAATLSTESIYDAFRGSTFFHGHTYTGNALACAAALANLDIFRDDQVITNLAPAIKALEDALVPLAQHQAVGDVRHRGLMVGIELCQTNGEPLPPTDRIGAKVCQQARAYNVILRPLGDVIVLMPPLSSTPAELTHLVEVTAQAIDDIL